LGHESGILRRGSGRQRQRDGAQAKAGDTTMDLHNVPPAISLKLGDWCGCADKVKQAIDSG
jgi:hypothetical protein